MAGVGPSTTTHPGSASTTSTGIPKSSWRLGASARTANQRRSATAKAESLSDQLRVRTPVREATRSGLFAE